MDIEKISVGGNEYDVCDAAARAMNSDEFSTAASYTAGDYCIYNNTLYKFTAAKSAGAWDSSKVAATQIGDELSQLNSNSKYNALYLGSADSLKDALENLADSNKVVQTIIFNRPSENVFASHGITTGHIMLFYSSSFWTNHIYFRLSTSDSIYIGSVNITNNTLDTFTRFSGTSML